MRNFHDLGALNAICDKDSTVLDNFKEKYEGISTTEDLDYLLDESVFQINAVAIATPAVTHYTLVKKCLLAGKHVFVEKPLALTGEEGQDLIEIAEKNHLTLMVGNPAKQKGWMCACGIQLVFKGNRAKCIACKRKYKRIGTKKIVEE